MAIFRKISSTSKKMGDFTMLLEHQSLPVKVVQNKNAKHLILRIMPNGQKLRLTVPAMVTTDQAEKFLRRKRNWVATRLAKMPEPVLIADGNQISFCGITHDLIRIDRPHGPVVLDVIAGKPALLIPGKPEHFVQYTVNFLKQQALEALQARVQAHVRTLGVQPRTIRITDTKSCWGSCSSIGTLSFSWRIIMAPPEILDYLAAHEVAHLREMNHSISFWKLVEQLCPEKNHHSRWLRINGPKLHAVQI